ncbi:hypothetical protein BS47DRAFT_1344510 [Hydnum rufescens UP504]|uniref:Ser-Thr-rich glycosyl-phosphatidyl-inositol-anchored membrane family-domain-containing protein n=1 Tax=Hydnum rufescens UP504 TaxID=1448309 RepID=A0A9P6DTI4_9AGAM|nr:hypothetical protein BS47DRAFT_1344510 [Hydnum rufescens UP504]
MRAASLLLAVLPLAASALQVITPSGWKGNTTVTLGWTWDSSDPPFSIELGNPNIHDGLLAQGPIAISNNVQPNTNNISFELPELPPGTGYFISLVAISDISTVYSTSASFNIASNPLTTTTTSFSTPRTSNAVSTNVAVSSTLTSGPVTTLLLNPSTTSSSSTSTAKSGATSILIRRHESVWSSPFATGALVSIGAFLAGLSVF